LFGGFGVDADGVEGDLNDLWEFDPSTKEWTWVSGSTTEGPCSVNGFCARPGVYGKLGTAAVGNVAGGRYGALSWVDGSGDFWIFGGLGCNANTTSEQGCGYLNDFWEFNPSTKEWAWMGGSSTISQLSASYGTMGVPSTGNIPGSLFQATSWTDSEGNLWLFGGLGFEYGQLGYIPSPIFIALNDTWVYKPLTDVWPVAATPTFTVNSGSYTTAVLSVGILDGTAGASIYYTLDGSTPTTGSAVYSSMIEIPSSNTVTVNAIAVGHDHLVSGQASATYTVLPPPALAPVISPGSGDQSGSVVIMIADLTPGAVIHYTLDYSTPLVTSPVYAGPILRTEFTVIRAIATAPNYLSSPETGAQYTIVKEAPTPMISPAPGNYTVGQLVTLTDADPTATLRYTTDGSTPTTHSNFYSHPFALTGSETINAIAIATGDATSAVLTSAYTTTGP